MNNKDYVGCFFDPLSNRQLTELTQDMATCLNLGTLKALYYVYSTTIMTISYCISICFSLEFKYAGLNYGYMNKSI
jgi:hypothetical protein